MKIRPVEPSASMRTEGQTDGQADRHEEASSRFSHFVNGPKN
jgi:hypothetical protein